jgi:hypothetical protein
MPPDQDVKLYSEVAKNLLRCALDGGGGTFGGQTGGPDVHSCEVCLDVPFGDDSIGSGSGGKRGR